MSHSIPIHPPTYAVQGRLIGCAECMVSAVTAGSADGKQLKLPLSDRLRSSLVCGFLFISVTKVNDNGSELV
jgi:hypothetical protein